MDYIAGRACSSRHHPALFPATFRSRHRQNKRMQADQIPPLQVDFDSEFSFGGIGRLILDVLISLVVVIDRMRLKSSHR